MRGGRERGTCGVRAARGASGARARGAEWGAEQVCECGAGQPRRTVGPVAELFPHSVPLFFSLCAFCLWMVSTLSEYEKQRLRNIAQNEAVLKALGLSGGCSGSRKKKKRKEKK